MRAHKQGRDVESGTGASPSVTVQAEAVITPVSGVSSETQKQAQDVETGTGASPGFAGEAEAMMPTVSGISTEVQQQNQDAEASSKGFGEADEAIPTTSDAPLGSFTSLDHPTSDTSLDDFVTAAGSISSPNAQFQDVPPSDSRSPTTSGQTGEFYDSVQEQEMQKADGSPSENLRPNAQNLRYGGYPAQSAPQHRNTPLGSGRLQSTSKLGTFEPL